MTMMIDRVARAMFDATNEHDETWDTEAQEIKTTYLIMARAAIEAMREPTWQMCSAGGMEHSRMVEEKHADADDPDCRYIFEAMIDAALNEQVSG